MRLIVDDKIMNIILFFQVFISKKMIIFALIKNSKIEIIWLKLTIS